MEKTDNAYVPSRPNEDVTTIGTESPCTAQATQEKEQKIYSPGEGLTGFGNTPYDPSDNLDQPRWLLINVLIARATSWIMFVLSVVVMAFAGLVMEDLRYDDGDYECSSNYVKDAYVPADGSTWNPSVIGQYHDQCVLLYRWTYIIVVAGSFSVARIIIQGVIPVFRPTSLSMQYTQGSFMDRHTTPSGVYLLQTFFSFVPWALYLAGAIILGTSRLINGPEADDVYRIMYIVCLVLVTISMLFSGHQTVTTAIASYYSRGWLEGNSGRW